MMPTWVHESPKNPERADAIGAELAPLDYDIVCFEKAFDGGAQHEPNQ